MAKANKSKTVVEETVVSEIEPPIEQMSPEVVEQVSELVEMLKVPQPIKSETLEAVSEKIFLADMQDNKLSMEQKIINFMATRPDGNIKLNDFLKSLYPIPKMGEPAEYLRQGESKALKGLLIKMQSEGKIRFADDQYLNLGKFYYTDGDTQTKYHNILTTVITAKK